MNPATSPEEIKALVKEAEMIASHFGIHSDERGIAGVNIRQLINAITTLQQSNEELGSRVTILSSTVAIQNEKDNPLHIRIGELTSQLTHLQSEVKKRDEALKDAICSMQKHGMGTFHPAIKLCQQALTQPTQPKEGM